MKLRRYTFVLSIYLNTRGCAFVLFEGQQAPVDWGMREIRGSRKHKRCLECITKILDGYLPDILVIQNTSEQGTQRVQRIAKLNSKIAELAETRGIPVYTYSRDEVRSGFAYVGFLNKQVLAQLIAKHIPAFERYLPPPRKPWMSEDHRMGIFDAAALGLAFYQRASGSM